MSKKSKLIERFLSVPADFTWDELKKVLSNYGYNEFSKGRTSGSKRKFVDKEKNLILLHEPHPSKIVKKKAIKDVVENLNEKGKLRNG